MEDDNIPSSCNFLKDPLSLSDLIATGTNFEINTNFDEGFSNDIFEELNLGSDNEDDAGNPLDRETLVSPWTRPFSELKEQMVKLNEHIYKKITKEGNLVEGAVPLNSRVCIRYNGYWEGEGAPFDSSFLRGSSFNFYTNRNDVIEGLEAAVRTMYRGEQAQFIISYELLFREMGCPPRVKPRADGLFIVELVSFNAVGDVDADQQIPQEDRNKYRVVVDKVKEIHLKGLDFFSQGLYKNACRAFEKAVDALSFCHLADEAEQREQTAFLLKLFTNLAVCYIKVNLPSKTCIMCKEIRHLTHNKPSCKAIFQEGRALLMLGEYDRARRILTQAQRMEPQNADISNELKILEQRYSRYKENEKVIWTKAMGLKKQSEQQQKAASVNNTAQSQFQEEMRELMQSFKTTLNTDNLKLPKGLTDKEIDAVGQLAQSMELKLTVSQLDDSVYILSKIASKSQGAAA